MTTQKIFWTPQVWLRDGWAHDVRLSSAPDGTWQKIETGVAKAQACAAGTSVTYLDNPVLPGLVNAHSHAFQRAIAGLTERSSGQDDDFWSWRDRMYSAALRVTPAQLEAIATLLYAELLQGGYTHVCEFHYLHNDLDGKPYANPLEMSLALVRAANTVGIGLTLLPTLYMRSGFGTASLRDDQRRFASSPDSVLRLVQGIEGEGGLVNAGIAIHSLRAVDIAAIREVSKAAEEQDLAVHIHIAEQVQEVDDCLALHRQRPISYLLSHAKVNARWNLVHATHTSAPELEAISHSGASIVICPTTEANLGDGVFDYVGYGKLKGKWSIGSDSHASRSWVEELRLLEYAQRLTLRRRNIAASVAGNDSTAAALFDAALAGGSAATSQRLGGIAVGNRADFLVLDSNASALLGVPGDRVLDALVFSSPSACFNQVFVAGRQVVNAGLACGVGRDVPQWSGWMDNFRKTMNQLWR